MSAVKIDYEAIDEMLKNYEDFHLLSRLISQCADDAWNLTGAEINMNAQGEISIYQSTIVKLMECYEKSYFHMKMKGESQEIREEDLKKCRKKCWFHDRNIENESIKCDKKCYYYREMKDSYLKLVRKQFEKYLNDVDLMPPTLKYRCYNQAQFNLLLPVVFFSLIVLNEYNFETQKWRNKQLKKGKGPSWQINDPYKLEERNLDYYAINTSVKEVKKNKLKKSIQQERIDATLISVNDMISSLSSAMKYVEQSDNIARYTGYANMGIFFYQILNAMYDPDRPMDTILRLFMMDAINPELLTFARTISSEMDDVDVEEATLLYYFSVVDNKEKKNLVSCRTSEEFPVSYMGQSDLGGYKKEDRTIEDYLSLYNELTTQIKFNVSEPMDIIRFYIDPDILELYVNANQSILVFIEAAKKVQECLSSLQYVTKMSKLIGNLDHYPKRVNEEKELKRQAKEEALYLQREKENTNNA